MVEKGHGSLFSCTYAAAINRCKPPNVGTNTFTAFMIPCAEHMLERLCVAGISYHRTAVADRGAMVLPADKLEELYAQLRLQGIRSAWLLQTCNRVELYAFCSEAHLPISIWFQALGLSADHFWRQGYTHTGMAAARHLFRVASGLDSQLLGDFDIQGQIKQAVTAARGFGMIGPVMDRLTTTASRTSKQVKASTAIGRGTVSVSFATVAWLRHQVKQPIRHMLVLGLGKFGCAVARNMLTYFPEATVWVANRTNERAADFACEAGALFIPFDQWKHILPQADVVILNTGAGSFLLEPSDIPDHKPRWLIDLSVPANINPAVAQLPGVSLAHVDDISAIAQKTLEERSAALPQAQQIVDEHLQLWKQWLNERVAYLRIRQYQQAIADRQLWDSPAYPAHEVMAAWRKKPYLGCQLLAGHQVPTPPFFEPTWGVS